MLSRRQCFESNGLHHPLSPIPPSPFRYPAKPFALMRNIIAPLTPKVVRVHWSVSETTN